MATLLLAAAGATLGGTFGSLGATIGEAVGGVAGALIDHALLRSGASLTGPRLSDLDVQASTEGEPIARVYGRVRISGQVIWATRFEEEAVEGSSGGKGGVSTTTYRYYANFAVGLCEGPIHRIGRVWADGTLLDLDRITLRVHLGGEDQEPDALILARQGEAVPAYRGIAYVVFERLPLDDWGNRIPQLAFEVIRVVEPLEPAIRALTLIPGATEYGLSPIALTRVVDGANAAENRHVTTAASDFLASLDEAIDLCPNLSRIALVVTWFGDDLRAGVCRPMPGVEAADKVVAGDGGSPFSAGGGLAAWAVAGLRRGEARLVGRVDGRSAYGGTPSDATVIAAIRAIRARGLAVTLYPFLAMDVAAGNGRPDPWGGAEQAAFPWRGRITCHPAPGIAGGVDRSAAARTQIEAFVGSVPVSAFSLDGEAVVCARPDEWSFRRMILHMAHLAVAAGGVDAFLLGSEFVGLGVVRDETGRHPFVEALSTLAADVRGVLGAATVLTYGADWSEWSGHRPADGSGDVIFHLDPLWASPAIDVIGIDAWFPLTDWRRGDHLDARLADRVTDRDHLDSRIEGGENFDWYYASPADRIAQRRTPIVDTAHGEDWVFRPKDLAGWWTNLHHDRPGGVRSATPTAWVPGSKPIWLTEVGCPAVDLGCNEPAAFPDPKSSESRVPFFSAGVRDDFVQRRTLEVILDHWNPELNPDRNPVSSAGVRMLPADGIHLWTWDARPFPAFPSAADVWADASAWATGHWLTGRLGGLSVEGLIAAVLADVGFTDHAFRAVAGHLDGFVIDRRMSTREALDPVLAAFGVDALDVGTAIRFAGRDRRVDATFALDDLVESGSDPVFRIRRTQESELPNELSATFSDALLEFRRTTVTVGRRLGGSRRASTADLAVVAPIETMVAVADAWLEDLWSGRSTIEASLDPTRIEIEPGDLLDLELEGRRERVMVTGLTDGAARAFEARTLDPAAGRPIRGGTRLRGGRLAPVRGTPIVHVLDIAHPDESADLHRPYLAAWASPWSGPLAVRRVYEGLTTVALATVERPAVLGVTLTDLAPGPAGVWDRANRLDVRLSGGALAGAPERLVLEGANRAAVRAVDGSWEIVQFAEADLVDVATWRLSDLLRRQGGSDDAGAAPIPAGAPFVLLDERLIVLPIGREDVGRDVSLTVGPAADPWTAPSWVPVTASPRARGYRPWSPTRLVARPDPTSGDVVFGWIRRSRVAGADSWSLLEVPLGAASERWRLVVEHDGATVVSVETATPTWTWSRSDRDAALGPSPAQVTMTVVQVDPDWGDGTPRAAVVRV